MSAAAVNSTSVLVEYGFMIPIATGVIIAVMGFLLRRSINQVDRDLNEVKNWLYGSADAEGIVSRVTAQESISSETRKDVDKLESRVNGLQMQIVDNQKTLTKHISGVESYIASVDKKIDVLIAYLEGKKDKSE